MTITKWIEIDNVRLNRSGFVEVVDLMPLLGGSEHLGSDRIIPGGTPVAKQRQLTVTTVPLNIAIRGVVSFDGTSHADEWDGLYDNIHWLHDNILAIPSGDGTRTAKLHWDSETEVTKPVHVIPPLDLRRTNGPMARGILRLSFPEGAFTPA